MKTLDRYIIRMFLVNFSILFIVIMGLITLLDLIINVDEFVQAGETVSDSPMGRFFATLSMIVDFYGPMVFLFYVYIGGLLPIAAAGFTLSQMVRNRELIAILASGISMRRVALPIMIAGLITNIVLFIDQEVVIPSVVLKLQRGQSDMKDGGGATFRFHFVPDKNGALFSAAEFDPNNQEMHKVTILPRDETKRAFERITASTAIWNPEKGGWELVDGEKVRRVVDTTAIDPEDRRGQKKVKVAFFETDLNPTVLLSRHNSRILQMLSIRELRDLAANSSLVDENRVEQIVHSRFSLIAMNMLILMMGLPFYLVRAPTNMLMQTIKSVPLCVGAWAGGLVMLQMEPVGMTYAMIAWMPVCVYLPVALGVIAFMKT